MRRRKPRAEVEDNDRREVRTDARLDKIETKKASKADLILAKAELAKAKASKRKALVALIVVGLIAYLVLSSGAGSGILDKVKSFIPMGE